jgi:hypothetical protein
MIEVRNPKVSNNNCMGCENDNEYLDDIQDILISRSNGKQQQIPLCKECREELMQVLIKLSLPKKESS